MTLDPNLLLDVSGRHPARRLAFDELYAGLGRAAAEGTVFIWKDGGLELYGYSTQCRFQRRWDRVSLIARGLVIDPAARRVVATPFPKFFNYGEGGHALPDEPFEVTEKVDGSLGIVFHHAGRWRVTTRGSLVSDQGRWATEYLRRAIATDRLVPGTTYLVEIVYPANRVVIPYDFEGLILLGAYDEAGDESPRHGLERVAGVTGLRLVGARSYPSFDDLLSVARGLCRDEEGFVVRFAGGLRVKIKGEEYCRVHRMMCDCTPLAIWEVMMNGDDLGRMRADLPEEMTGDFDTICRLTLQRLDDLVAEVRAAAEATAHLSDKDLGRMIRDEQSSLSPVARKFVFGARKSGFLEAVYRPGPPRQQAFRLLRPTRNTLPGYIPSNAATRFAAESK